MIQHTSTSPRPRDASPARKLSAIALGIVVCAIVFAVIDYAFGRFAAARFPAPEQALVWARIGHFVAAILALGAGAQAARRVWLPR